MERSVLAAFAVLWPVVGAFAAHSKCLREVLATGESDDRRRPVDVFVQEQKR